MRVYGNFPFVLQRYVREKKMLTLQEAIRKMTSLPAQTLGLRDRGIIKEGMWADLVIFNPRTVRNTAIHKLAPRKKHEWPVGIEYVLVNGRVAVEKEKPTGTLAGKVLRRGT